MNTDRELLHGKITEKIIVAAYKVHNTLGCGLLEKVYENALAWELELMGGNVVTQKEFKVRYREKEVGLYYADLIIDSKVVVEVKAIAQIDNVHRAQILNYMKIAAIRVGMIVNFAKPKLEYERLIL